MTGGLPRLGVVTIGQSPRVDLVPELLPRLGRVEVVERGALDDLGRAEIAALAPGETTVERLG
ncbi:AroM family protein, partial [Actinoalloteichus caeruleus]|uniref:AroM family protein n=1 Tax=Actinoalloteichus cyanogriseus TaxID=2893586 RepID=UPI0004AB7A45